ncbi:MAG: YbaN family protein [Xylophilus ampelinus]
MTPPDPPPPSDRTPSRRPLPAPARWLLAGLAALCIGLGVVGVFVPGMPTTVFVILAAWAAARGSPRLHGWLLGHRLFGPMLRDWQAGGFVSRHAKWSATAAMAVCAATIAFTAHRRWTAALAIGCMAAVLAWLWRRPEPAPPR